MSNAQEIEDRAAYWLLRREEQIWGDVDQAALDAWLAESMAHKAAYWRLEYGWRKADRVAALGPASTTRSGMRRLSSLTIPVALAASILLALAGINRFVPSLVDEIAPQRIATGLGGHKVVPLDDGSQIELNTATTLRAAVTKEKRQIWLDRGEAFFEVAHSPQHPFVIYAGLRTITVLGTKFSVRRDGDKVIVSVLEGRVRIDDATKPAAKGVVVSSSTVTTGDVAIATGSSMLVAAETAEKVQSALAWRGGMLTFDKTKLSEVAVEFNRYNRVKLVIEDAGAAAIPIGGTFKASEVEAFARLLHDAYGLNFSHSEHELRISS